MRTLITLSMIALVSITAAVVKELPSAEAQQSAHLATGISKIGCQFKSYFTLPYRHCEVTIQPGTTQAAYEKIRRYPGNVTGGAGALGGTICAPAGPVAFVCAAALAWRSDVFIHAIQDAATSNTPRCVTVSWNTLLPPLSQFPTATNVTPSGERPHMIYTYNARTRDWDAHWGSSGPCQMPGFQPGLV